MAIVPCTPTSTRTADAETRTAAKWGAPIRAAASQGETSTYVAAMTAIPMTGPVIEAPAPRRALR